MNTLRNTRSVTRSSTALKNPESGDHIATAVLSDRDYMTIASLVERHLGIKMNRSKKPMIASRLLRRLRSLGMSTYAEYGEYLRSAKGAEEERQHLCDLITTHKTEFFRESTHFEILAQQVLPGLMVNRPASVPVSVWSAGCSTGQEVYTLAMVLATQMDLLRSPLWAFSVLGTDVSAMCVQKAEVGLYSEPEIDGIPDVYRKQFLLRRKDSDQRLYRFIPELRARTRFCTLNFIERHWLVDPVDIVFCRNVLIYFSAATQHAILADLCRCLRPNGYLFISHCETIAGMELPLIPMGRSVFRKV